MKTRKKSIFTLIIALMLMVSTLSVFAYTGSYSFDIVYSIKGTNVHSLSNVSTSTSSQAQSYDLYYNVSSTKYNYQVELYKNIFTRYSTPNIVADGASYSNSFGVISSGNYTINVFKTTGSGSNRIVGEGSVIQ